MSAFTFYGWHVKGKRLVPVVRVYTNMVEMARYE